MSGATPTTEVDQLVPDPAHMRQVLGHVPTAVCIVTTGVDGEPVGSTVGSFTSVSLDPPLVGFFSQHTSNMYAAVRGTGRFAVNVLAADQFDTCAVFSRRDPDRFERIGWSFGPRDNPYLDGSLAVLECTVESLVEAGDHMMVLGRVRELDALRAGAEPLVFWTGTLHGLRRADSES